MKQDDTIQPEIKEDLTAQIAQRKWSSLRLQFKASFYCSALGEESKFPFYNEMNNLFNDYATEHLNTTYATATGRSITEADVTSFVGDLLTRTCSNILDSPDGLRCESSKENKLFVATSPLNETNSEASVVRKKLSKLSKNLVCVQEATMKVIPNTPFNRRCQLSTIFNHRNAMISRDHKLRHRRLSLSLSPKPLNEIMALEQDDSQVEALEECNLAEVQTELNNLKRSLPFTEFSMEPLAESSMLEIPLKIKRSYGRVSDVKIIEEPPQSILEIPSFGSIDDLRVSSEKSLMLSKPNNDNKKTQSRYEAPPAWFQQFVNRYDNDMKRIHSKLDDISAELNKSLAQRPLTITRKNQQ